MENYPSNSKRPPSKRPEPPAKDIKKIVQGEVTTRKKPLGKRFLDLFVQGSPSGAARAVVQDIMIPALKDMMLDAGNTAWEQTLYGDTQSRPRGRGRPGRGVAQYAYNRITSPGSSPLREEPRRTMSRRDRANHNFDEIILESRAEANEIIEQMYEIVSKFEEVSVSDLYKMVGMDAEFTDEKWGWTDMAGSDVTRLSGGGYLLVLPRPEPLD